MKFKRNDFLATPDLTVDLQFSDLEGTHFINTLVKSVPECQITGDLHFDGKSRVISSLQYEGVMVVEDSITGEDLEVEFDTTSAKEYSFDPIAEQSDEIEIIRVYKDTLDLTEEAIEAIVYEAPMSITRLAREAYPQGEGWSLLSDQDSKNSLTLSGEDDVDPRWAKLKEFRFDEDD
ncbi:MAG: DUF177 domain-containing protein [Allobaculum sp.]|nr:DUF177 domain-containing protein [Allobaculum sp.]MDE5758603.1 DUF177 domain-containing protein [Allobaculum sp.]